MNRKIKLAHIGIGHAHSSDKLDCVLKYPELFEVVGYSEDDEEMYGKYCSRRAYQGLKRYTTEQLLSMDDVDAALVECDDENLIKYGLMCVNAGKHIHMDKPAGTDIAGYTELMKTAKQKNLTVQLGYMYRYNPAVMKAFELAKSGALGDILEVDTVMSTEHPASLRRWLETYPGGTIHFLGCHLVDLIYRIQGVPDKIIPFQKYTDLDGIHCADNDFAVFEYPKGVSTVRVSSFEVNGYGRRQLVVCGTNGSVELKPLETQNLSHFTDMYLSTKDMTAGDPYAVIRKELDVPAIVGRHDSMMMDFYKMVNGEMQNPYSYEYELTLQRLCLAACGIDCDYRQKISL